MYLQKGLLNYSKETKPLYIRDFPDGYYFNTYFNSLNLYLIKRYIGTSKVTLTIHCKGTAEVKVAYQFKKKFKYLDLQKCGDNSYVFDISSLPERGIIFPVVKGDIRNFEVVDFKYEIECESKPISPCILITTFNREKFLIPNLEKLNKCEGLAHVIIVDNARNVKLPDTLDKKKFTVIPNDNLGGTGGFTRGMIEAKKRGFSHVFIMDDDITLIPEVMEKAFSFVSSMKKEHENDWLGFSMLINDNPLVQYELGTKWNGVKMKLNHHNYKLDRVKYLEKNQINAKYNYSAWWSLMMPTSVIDKYGYPFPMFIKFDDIEYSLRRNGEEIILTNGFGVWHENFDKKFNPYLEYYLMRNASITNSLHLKHASFKTAWRYLRKAVKAYLTFKYVILDMLHLGYSDYLKGPEFFKNLNIEGNNNKVRALASKKKNIFVGLITIPFVSCFYFFKIWCTYRKVKQSYIDHYNELTSLDYWEGVYNHE